MDDLPVHDGQPRVAAVVLNWNGRKVLLNTLRALEASRYPLCEIILVDNGSTDGSVEAVRSEFPNVTIIAERENHGASEGRNIGIRRALEQNPDYVFNIDNDIDVFPATISELVAAAAARPDAGVVGTMMYFKDKPDLIQNVGAAIRFKQNIHAPIGWRETDRGQYQDILDVDMVGSGAMLTRSDVFRTVGMFDGGYLGCQLDDTDFCMKVRAAGYRVYCNPRAKILHDFDYQHKYTFRRKYLEAHNAVLFVKKHGSIAAWAKFLIYSLGSIPAAFLVEAPKGNARGVVGKVKGLFDALLNREEKAIAIFRSAD